MDAMQTPQTSLNMYLKRRRRRRLALVFCGLCFIAAITALIFYALQDKAGFFRIPSDITAEDKSGRRLLRLGGYVEPGSVERASGTDMRFYVTDFHQRQQVRFNGLVPDLFREGQGVIAEGRFDADGLFIADRVLAKHDENYVPKDVADRIKAAEGRSGNDSPAGRR